LLKVMVPRQISETTRPVAPSFFMRMCKTPLNAAANGRVCPSVAT
jgi:hypothetical protein